MGQQRMDTPPAKPKRSSRPSRAKPPEALDTDLRRALLCAAESCDRSFEEKPTHHAFKLGTILRALERDPRLIASIYDKLPAAPDGVAVTTAIGGVRVRRAVVNKHGDLVFQSIGEGRHWEGPSMVARTRWAIAAFDAEPLDVAAKVLASFPPLLKADCRRWSEVDADQVGLPIADLLVELRSLMVANRERLRDDAERCYQANTALLDSREWKAIPATVLRTILRKLGHPAPDNLIRD